MTAFPLLCSLNTVLILQNQAFLQHLGFCKAAAYGDVLMPVVFDIFICSPCCMIGQRSEVVVVLGRDGSTLPVASVT